MPTSPPSLSLPGSLLIQWRLGSYTGRSGLWCQQLQGCAYPSSCPISPGAVRHYQDFRWQLDFRIGITSFMFIFKMAKKKIKINQVHFPYLRNSFSVVRLTMNKWMATLRLFQQDFRGSSMKLPALACLFAHWISSRCKTSTSSPWPASTLPYEPSRHNDEQLWKLFSPAAFQKNLPILKQGFIMFRQLLLF